MANQETTGRPTLAEFQDQVMARLGPLPDPKDEPVVRAGLAREYRKGFSVADAAAYCRCLEEFDPTLDEDTALARMVRIDARYPARSV